MSDSRTAYREKLVDDMFKYSASEPGKAAAVRAQLDASFLEEVNTLVQATRENVVEAVLNLGSQVGKHRVEIEKAAKSAEENGWKMEALTRTLVWATGFYVLLTGGLLVVGVLTLLSKK